MTKADYLKQIDSVIANGKYKDNWQSLSDHKTPDWYYKGKFGIFIHWGIYSVPAFGNEWYSRNMYNERHREFEHHIKTYGRQKDFGYKDFVPMFKVRSLTLQNGLKPSKTQAQNSLCRCGASRWLCYV
jgi:alpha-L-fucosidase